MELGNYKFIKQPNQHTKGLRRYWYNFVWYVKRTLQIIAYGSIGVAYSLVFFFAGQYSSPIHVTAEQINLDKLPQKIEQMKTDLVDDISNRENRNNIPAIPDDNKRGSLPLKDKVSYGCMQYKISTVQYHYKTIHGKDLSDIEAAMLAIDCPKAKELAKEAIFNMKGALNAWSVATQEMAIKVEFIRELNK